MPKEVKGGEQEGVQTKERSEVDRTIYQRGKKGLREASKRVEQERRPDRTSHDRPGNDHSPAPAADPAEACAWLRPGPPLRETRLLEADGVQFVAGDVEPVPGRLGHQERGFARRGRAADGRYRPERGMRVRRVPDHRSREPVGRHGPVR